MDVAVALLGEMHEKGILRPPLEPWVIAPPKRRPKRVKGNLPLNRKDIFLLNVSFIEKVSYG